MAALGPVLLSIPGLSSLTDLLLSLLSRVATAAGQRPHLRVMQRGSSVTDKWATLGVTVDLRVANDGSVPATICAYYVLGPRRGPWTLRRVRFDPVPASAGGKFQDRVGPRVRWEPDAVLNDKVDERGVLGPGNTLTGLLVCSTRDGVPSTFHGDMKATVVVVDHRQRAHKGSARLAENRQGASLDARRR